MEDTEKIEELFAKALAPEPRRTFYTYRCTTDKLVMHMERIEESGDRVQWPVFLGGRDWLLVCVKASS